MVDEVTNDLSKGDEAPGPSMRRRKRCRWTDPPPPKRKSRWGVDSDKIRITPQVIAATNQMSSKEREMFLLRMRIQQISQQIMNAKSLVAVQTDRSPSPEPVYDNHGVRLNTREQRLKDKLTAQRAEMIEEAKKLDPNFNAPAGYRKPQLFRKIPIPVDEYPDYNFIGLIIGPRGNTQKRMEKETNCKIAIRGKGSVVEGKRKHGRSLETEDEPLHVYLTGEDEASLNKAEVIIKKILVPVDESKNDHKAKQLRELAAIAGTLRDDMLCRVCGEAGHRIFQCPQRTGSSWVPANIRCAICGDRSHPTTDCPTGQKQTVEDKAKAQDDYASFMAELAGSSAPAQEFVQDPYYANQQQHSYGYPPVQQAVQYDQWGQPIAPPNAQHQQPRYY